MQMRDMSQMCPQLTLALQWLSQDLDFFPKKELLKKFRELFAKERSYPSTTKVQNLYITCTEYTKKI